MPTRLASTGRPRRSACSIFIPASSSSERLKPTAGNTRFAPLGYTGRGGRWRRQGCRAILKNSCQSRLSHIALSRTSGLGGRLTTSMRPGPQRSPRQPAGSKRTCELLVYALKPPASTVAVGMFQTGYGRLSFEHRTDGALSGPQSATGTTRRPHSRRIVLRRCPSALRSVEVINHLEEGSFARRRGLDTDHKSEPSLGTAVVAHIRASQGITATTRQ